MSWNNIRYLPEESGSYIVTIERQRPNSKPAFLYVAFYNSETIKWNKQDQFAGGDETGEEITDKITGWHDEVGIFVS